MTNIVRTHTYTFRDKHWYQKYTQLLAHTMIQNDSQNDAHKMTYTVTHNTCTYAHELTRTNTHAQAQGHVPMHTHAHTHTHTRTYNFML